MYRYKTIQEIYLDQVRKYLLANRGLMDQLKWVEDHPDACGRLPGETPVLTIEMLDEFIETLKHEQTRCI